MGIMVRRTTLTTLAAVVCLACSSAPNGPEESSRPNIVLILTEDQGWQDTSARLPTRELPRATSIARPTWNGYFSTPNAAETSESSTVTSLRVGMM